MSGGVDSSVAALLLKEAGFEVIGITMCFNLPDIISKRPRCCGLQGIEDARRVAHKLNIRHYVLNMRNALQEKVIDDFCSEYLKGRTPNPCVRCNQYLKFGTLLKKARMLGAGYLATGHYAGIKKIQDQKTKTVKYFLRKAKDPKKDQSYFLYRLGQSQLRRIIFPLSGYTKDEVRGIAKDAGLPVAEKLESQEICFLPTTDYREFLKAHLKSKLKPGAIVDRQGNILGRHSGLGYYTIGQRQGLKIALGFPIYVTRIDAKKNQIEVGRLEDACRRELIVGKIHFTGKRPQKKVALKVKIRYNHPEAPAEVIPQGKSVKVRFKEAQFAITPGQSAVFYDRDIVLGGGVIQKVTG
jgi:tRNA-specific 2-thiouridylase